MNALEIVAILSALLVGYGIGLWRGLGVKRKVLPEAEPAKHRCPVLRDSGRRCELYEYHAGPHAVRTRDGREYDQMIGYYDTFRTEWWNEP